MGVHDLWSILEPVRESVPLYSLSGTTLAVDLSLWVCEAQHVQAMMGKVTKPHLRNLFFRVSSLTLMGVKLVFVMEGEAPKIKADTMNKRTETRFGGFKKKPAPNALKTTTSTSRGRFKAVLRECAEMLDYLGVPWVTAAGEAEAMCAYLDSQGLVDGCITNDGDAFLYGARTVYRNFNMNSKDPHVECYQSCRVQTQLKLSRENLVGLAVLLGCDYIPKGIPGVGKEQALKFIHSLKGQTLLQKFAQWKDDNPGVCEEVVKKVPHCLVCRHPGSAKAHERGGCRLCDSQRFCQPQDFDHQCPCDWHRHEQRRQAMSLETSIRKKTLASQHFPFTEIIHEFLISKDKPVSHFKRRQPNLLSMQKFANDKMEWPKHYTSEKVLVLMTYTELMNRKYGRGMSSQIKPLRILKPRVRNAIACFEVIWTTPEHYVFPEDRPAESQHEVNTVEEESLFGVAFPELVESYLRDKALAEVNKTKKKKPKSKKEKPSDASDDITELLAQMSLQTSSASSSSRSQIISKPKEPEVVDLCPPVKHRENRADCTAPLPHGAASVAAASPSVSSVIDALHLSDIDWESASFTSSPAPQAAGNRSSEPDREVKEGRSGDTEQGGTSRSAAALCYTERPLRDRVLMRNAASALNQASNPLNDDVTHISSHDVASNQSRDTSSKGSGGCNLTLRKSDVAKTDPSSHRKGKAEAETLVYAAQGQAKDTRDRPQKSKFARSALSASSAPPQRLLSDPGPGDRGRNVPHATKKSVCLSLCSSSDEDSNTENRPSAPQRKSKMKPVHRKNKDGLFITDFLGKPASGSKTSSQTGTGAHQIPSEPKPQRHGQEADVSTTPVSIKGKGLDVAAVTAGGDDVVFSPASPVTVLDSDDSAICSDSPLPLAERLRLKFLK